MITEDLLVLVIFAPPDASEERRDRREGPLLPDVRRDA
jgi:hypothetical protein